MTVEKLFSDRFQCNDLRQLPDGTCLCRHHFLALTDTQAAQIGTFLLDRFYGAKILPVLPNADRSDDVQSGTTLAFRFTADAAPALQKLLAEIDGIYGYDAANAVPVNTAPDARTVPAPAPRTH